MFELPVQLEVNGKLHPIRNNGDFRVVLDCFAALNDVELDDIDRILSSLIIFYEEAESEASLNELFNRDIRPAAEKMFWFFSCGDNVVGNKHNYKLVDWEKDQQLIASAINKAAGTEIRSLDYLHWWTFMGYYTAIGDCTWSNVVAIRQKIKTGKKLEKNELKFKNDNPEYFVWDSHTIADKEAENSLFDLWNNDEEDDE